jgi:hypothetical protein
MARSLRDWQAVVRAVRRREPGKAAEVIRRRINGSRDAALKALRAEQKEQGVTAARAGGPARALLRERELAQR